MLKLVVVNYNVLSTSRGRERVARRSRTRSPRKASPPKKLCIRHLSRNVSKEHLNEIFAIYGTLKNCDLPSDRNHPHLGRGYGYIEYENVEDAEKVSYYYFYYKIEARKIKHIFFKVNVVDLLHLLSKIVCRCRRSNTWTVVRSMDK